MIEHCISSLKLNKEERQYRVYITDALMAIAENTSHVQGREGIIEYGRVIKSRWIDLLEPPSEIPEDNRPSEDIARDMWSRIRGH